MCYRKNQLNPWIRIWVILALITIIHLYLGLFPNIVKNKKLDERKCSPAIHAPVGISSVEDVAEKKRIVDDSARAYIKEDLAGDDPNPDLCSSNVSGRWVGYD